MAVFSDLVTIASDAAFQGRVQYAMEVAAVNVMAEAANTASHAQRVGFSQNVLRGSVSVFSTAFAVLTNVTIAGKADTTQPTAGGYGIPDADIQFAVNSLYSTLAGVPAN